jgi:hypothetical protein
MGSPWQEHDAAKVAAVQMITSLNDSFRALLDQTRETAGFVANVTGGELCANDYGRQAFQSVAMVPDKVDEITTLLIQAVEDLDRYIF